MDKSPLKYLSLEFVFGIQPKNPKIGLFNMHKIWFFAVFLCFFSACINQELDRDLLSKEPQGIISAAVPIGYKQTGLKDIFLEQLQQGKLVEDASGLLWFKYQLPCDTLSAAELFKFPTINQGFQMINMSGKAIQLDTLTQTLVLQDTFYVDFAYSNGLNGEELDSIVVDSMDFRVALQTAYTLNGNAFIDFPESRNNNNFYTKKLIINSDNLFSDWKNYSLVLKKIDGVANAMQMVLRLELSKSDEIIPAGAVMANLNIQFNRLVFKGIYGYLGQFSFDLPTVTSVFDFYNQKLQGSFNFDHLSLKLVSDNSIGLPFGFFVQEMSVTTTDLQSRQIVFSDVLSAQNPAMPAYPSFLQIGQRIADTTSMDMSSLQLFSENYATEAIAQINGTCNPDGFSTQNFALNSSKMLLNLQFDIPFWGNTKHIVIQDTLPFVLKDFYADDFASIQRLLFILNTTNAFPMDAAMQIYFCNQSMQVLDSLSDEAFLIPAAQEKQADEKVVPLVNETIKIAMSKEKVLTLEPTCYIIIRSSLNTPGAKDLPPLSWKFYADYYLFAQVGVAAELENNP